MPRLEQCDTCSGGIEAEFTAAGSRTCGSCLVAAFRQTHPDLPVPAVRDMLPVEDAVLDNTVDEE